MKKWMKICLMAAASAMLLAGCGTKDNTAETVRNIVEESRSHLIYVNEYNAGANEDDE